MAKLTRTQRIHKANALGLSLRGFNYYKGGGELGLAERSPRGIKRQAQQEIDTAFTPVEHQLNLREISEQALVAKRSADEDHFAQWVKDQTQSLRDQADARSVQLQAYATEASGALKTQLDSLRSAYASRHPDAPNNELLDTRLAADTAAGSNASSALLQRNALGRGYLDAASVGALGNLAAQRAQVKQEDAQRQARLSDDFAKLGLEKGSATSKRLADLTANESTTAQARISQRLAGDKLRLDAAKFGQTTADKKAARDLQKRQQDISNANADASRAQSDSQYRAKFEAQYGRTPEQFQAMKPGEQARLIARRKAIGALGDGKGGKGEKGPSKVAMQKARSKAGTEVERVRSIAQRKDYDPKDYKNPEEMARDILAREAPAIKDPSAAFIAAFQLFYPGQKNWNSKKHPKSQKAWQRLINTYLTQS